MTACIARGADYYVATDGSNANSGTATNQAWLTIQYAVTNSVITPGDTIFVLPGIYPEEVTKWRTNLTTSYITLKSTNAHEAQVFRLDMKEPRWKIDGFKISGSDIGGGSGMVQLRAAAYPSGAHFTIVTNCLIDSTNSINTGGILWDNDSTGRTVEYPYGDEEASGCLIVDNIIQNITAQVALSVSGQTNEIRRNRILNHVNGDMTRAFGRTNYFIGNTYRNNRAAGLTGVHADWLQTWGWHNVTGLGTIGMVFEGNWIENVEGQLCQMVQGKSGENFTNLNGTVHASGWKFRNNVFIDITHQGSVTFMNTEWINNTFIRCATNIGTILTFGSDLSNRGTSEGMVVLNNLLIDCMSHVRDNINPFNPIDAMTGQLWTNAIIAFNGVTKFNTAASPQLWDPIDEDQPATANGIDPDYWVFNGVDPGVVNHGLNDFHLFHWSPARGTGTNASSYGITDDYEGNTRSTWDLGAFAWTGTNTAHYFVSTNGNDTTGNGSYAAPWRTIQKAADTLTAGQIANIQVGVYDEYVRCRTPGSEGSMIEFRALPANHPIGKVRSKQFRLEDPYIRVSGFELVGPQGTLAANVWIEENASFCVVDNMLIRDTPKYIGRATINTNLNQLTTFGGIQWSNIGFNVGGTFELSGYSLTNLNYINRDTTWTIATITTSNLTVTGQFDFETNTTPFIIMYAGTSHEGTKGIHFDLAGGTGATNCSIVMTEFRNLFGHNVILNGQGHLWQSNRTYGLGSYTGFRGTGSDHKFMDNLWLGCTNPVPYTHYELSTLYHPQGAGNYDYVVGFLHSSVNAGTLNTSNILFLRNWIQNVENPLCQLSEPTLEIGAEAYGWQMISNVFIGVMISGSGGRNGLRIEQNLFLKCGYDQTQSAAVSIGGNSPTKQSTNQFIIGNAFIDIGDHSNTNKGGYSFVNVFEGAADSNYIASAETLSWQIPGNFVGSETNGAGGLDPLFANINDPLGADQLPFTYDDGIMVMAGSPMAGYGNARAKILDSNDPSPTFKMVSPHGWHDLLNTNWNPSWVSTPIYDRVGRPRPWQTYEAIATVPVAVIFEASNSVARGGESIVSYEWSFGDGNKQTNTFSRATNIYTGTGVVAVGMIIVDSNTARRGQTNYYRMLGEGPPIGPSTPPRKAAHPFNRGQGRGGIRR